MIRVVFDTNVLISALFNPKRPPAQLLQLVLEGKLKLIISPQIIREIERVLTYPRVKKLLKKRKAAPGEIGRGLTKAFKVAILTPGDLAVEVIPGDPKTICFWLAPWRAGPILLFPAITIFWS